MRELAADDVVDPRVRVPGGERFRAELLAGGIVVARECDHGAQGERLRMMGVHFRDAREFERASQRMEAAAEFGLVTEVLDARALHVREPALNYTRDEDLDIRPGQIVVVDFNPERGGIVIQ